MVQGTIWYYVPVMSFVSRGVWKCDECGHEWLPGKDWKPDRCPSRKCRSTKWDKDGGGTEVMVKPVEPVRSKVELPVSVVVPKKTAVGGGCRKCGKKLLEWGSEMMRCVECGINHPKD